jgi:hypothetical protein
MAILMALEQWRSYFQHAEFQIITDHRSLVQLTEQRLQPVATKGVYQAYWSAVFFFSIRHI